MILSKDVASGKSSLFAPRLPFDYAVWLGEIKPLSFYKVISLGFWILMFFMKLDGMGEP